MENTNALAEQIIGMVKERNGIKMASLVKDLSKEYRIPVKESETLIQELVSMKKLIEIEYSSDMFTAHSFLVPANTRINVRGVIPKPAERIV